MLIIYVSKSFQRIVKHKHVRAYMYCIVVSSCHQHAFSFNLVCANAVSFPSVV